MTMILQKGTVLQKALSFYERIPFTRRLVLNRERKLSPDQEKRIEIFISKWSVQKTPSFILCTQNQETKVQAEFNFGRTLDRNTEIVETVGNYKFK